MKLEQNLMLTDWFLPDVKPVRVGVYQTRIVGTDGFLHEPKYSFWTGERWMDSAVTISHAVNRHFIGHQHKRWRGLSNKP